MPRLTTNQIIYKPTPRFFGSKLRTKTVGFIKTILTKISK